MLRLDPDFFQAKGAVIVMSDVQIVTATIKTTLLEIAKQASTLGAGLQNAAPGDKAGAPNTSIQYLLATADKMQRLAEECEKLIANAHQHRQSGL